MSNKQKYFYSLLAVAALIAASIYGFINNRPGLGLDLRGGLSVVLTAKESKGVRITQKAMDQAILIMQERVNKLGVSEPTIEQQGSRNIIVQLPGIKDAEQALDVIGQRALLEFRIVQKKYEGQSPEQMNFEISKKKKVLEKTLLTGKVIDSATATFSSGQDQLSSAPIVEFTLTPEGTDKFAKITKENINKRLAIVLDGRIITAPNIKSEIPDGKGVIEGIESIDEARRIALVMQTGNLPFALDISQHQQVGPTLGKDSLNAALMAGIIGVALVAVFMLGYYRIFGVVTWFTLAVFGCILAGLYVLINLILVQLGSAGFSLSLPSIAAIIFVFGSAADSSIIVYERIKEEIKGGRSIRSAMDVGFAHGFRTFVDADLVAFLTAAILFYFGVGPVKGFALVIMLGIVADLTTSFLFTRSIIGLLASYDVIKSTALFGLRREATPE